MNPILLAGLVALLFSYALTPVVRLLANRWGMVAHPGGRRVHTRPMPLMGGLAMFAGFVAAVGAVIALRPELRLDQQTQGIIIGCALMAFVGVMDDKFELPGWAQAVSILAGGLVLVAYGTEIRYITNPFRGGHLMPLGALSIPITLLWVLMVTKAVDCMDGLDGLAAGISAIAACTLMLMAIDAGPRFLMSGVMAAALMGAALGFLRFNYPPAKVFMGTVGAQFLGFALAGVSIAGAFKIATLVAVAAPVLVLSVPLFDTTFVVLKRAVTGKRIHEADTSHLHHRLVNKGLSHRQTIWIIYALTIASCAVAYLLFSLVKK